ncbi:MAG TPA: outer membrane beta-barrel protein, partial [Verrucomicrobiae bacterium]
DGLFKDMRIYAGVINGFNGNGATGTFNDPHQAQGIPLMGVDQTSFYVGTTIVTPIYGLKLGASFDYAAIGSQPTASQGFTVGAVNPQARAASSYRSALALYASYELSEKFSIHARGEYFTQSDNLLVGITAQPPGSTIGPQLFNAPPGHAAGLPSKAFAATGTLQYDLWKNVISRLEFRWDHAADGRYAYGGTTENQPPQGGTPAVFSSNRRNAYLVAANFIYKF